MTLSVKKLAFISSNQHQNQYAGMAATEEKVLQEVTQSAIKALSGIVGLTVANFWVPGAGAKSTDELARAIKDVNAWGPDFIVSLHSDAVGDAAVTGVMPLVYSTSRTADADRLGRLVAKEVGLPYKYVTQRTDLAVLSATHAPAILLEIGEHATQKEAAFLANNAEAIGQGVARALIQFFGWVVVAVKGPQPVYKSVSGLFVGDKNGDLNFEDTDYLLRRHADILLHRLRDLHEKRFDALERGLAVAIERIEALEGEDEEPVEEEVLPVVSPALNGVGLQTPVMGKTSWGVTSPWERLHLALTKAGVSPEAPVLADLYLAAEERYGIRADVAISQMLLETDNWKFSGQVPRSYNNPCGLKTTDGATFAKFSTLQDGVTGHVTHLLWYATATHDAALEGSVDPRHLGPHQSNGVVTVVADLAGKWAPTADYAKNIVKRAESVGLGVK